MRDKYAWWQLFEHIEAIAHFCMAKYQDITFGLFLFVDK